MSTRRVLVVAAAGVLVAAGLASTAPTASAASRRPVPRTAPTWTSKAHKIGAADRSATAAFKVYLAPNGGLDALKKDVAARSDPSSPTYRHFLTTAQYHARFDA